MSILFILPPIEIQKSYPITHPPLGISYLIAYLKEKKIPCFGVDLQICPAETVYKLISENKPTMVCLSICIFTTNNSVNLSRTIKSKFPNITITWGGAHSEFLTEHLKEKYLDYLVFGEGEETIYNLYINFTNSNFNPYIINNLAFFYNGQILRTPRKTPEYSLDSLPFPDRNWIDISKYQNPLPSKTQCYIIGSRYCAHSCNFCINSCNNNRYRARSVQNIIEEVQYIKKTYPQYNRFMFVDETFNSSKEMLTNFCLAIEKEQIEWLCNIRAEEYMTDKNILKMLKSSGNISMEIGVESGSQNILNMNNKNIKLDNVMKLLEITTSLDMFVVANFMMPHIQDTKETLNKTLELAIFVAKNFFTYTLILKSLILPSPLNEQLKIKFGVKTTRTGEIICTKNLPDYIINAALKKATDEAKNYFEKQTLKFFKSQKLDIAKFAEQHSSFQQNSDLKNIMSLFL